MQVAKERLAVPKKLLAYNTKLKLQAEVKSANNEIQCLQDSMKLEIGRPQANSSSVEQQASITFKLSGYKAKKKMNSVFISPMFYTGPRGYHMAVRVSANGVDDSRGTHLSVYAPVVKGPYDAELKWPFTGEVTFTLLNQLEDENHWTSYFKGQCFGFEGCTWVCLGFPRILN